MLIVDVGPSEEEELNEETEDDEAEEVQVRYDLRESDHGSGRELRDVEDASCVQEYRRDFHEHGPVGVQKKLLREDCGREHVDRCNVVEEEHTGGDREPGKSWVGKEQADQDLLVIHHKIDSIVEKVSNRKLNNLGIEVSVVVKWSGEHQFCVVAEEEEQVKSGELQFG